MRMPDTHPDPQRASQALPDDTAGVALRVRLLHATTVIVDESRVEMRARHVEFIDPEVRVHSAYC